MAAASRAERPSHPEPRRPREAGRTPHALLFQSGSRFETIASDRLAFHGPITVTFWLKVADAREGILAIELNNFDFRVGASGLEFSVQYAHDLRYSDPGGRIWRHIAGTFDGSRMHLFVDGVQVATGPASLAGNWRETASIKVHEARAPAPVVLIDDLRVWTHLRSAHQVQLDMEHRPPDGDALAAVFDFDEGTGQRVEDRIAEGNHGWLGADGARPDSADPTWITDTPETPGDIAWARRSDGAERGEANHSRAVASPDASLRDEGHRRVRSYTRWLGTHLLPAGIWDSTGTRQRQDSLFPGTATDRRHTRTMIALQSLLCLLAGFFAHRRGWSALAFSLQSLIAGAVSAFATVMAGRAAYRAAHDPHGFFFLTEFSGWLEAFVGGLAGGAVGGFVALLVVNLLSGQRNWRGLLLAEIGYTIGIVTGLVGLWVALGPRGFRLGNGDPLLIALYLTGWVVVGSFMVAALSVARSGRS